MDNDEIESLLKIVKIEKEGKDFLLTCKSKKIFELLGKSAGEEHFKFKIYFTPSQKILNRWNINLCFSNFVLRRIDLNGAPHRNPDYSVSIDMLNKYRGALIEEDHIHIAIEGTQRGDEWAVPLFEIFDYENLMELKKILVKFNKICNIEANIEYVEKFSEEKYEPKKLY